MPGSHRRFHIGSAAHLEAALTELAREFPKANDATLCLSMGVCPMGLFGALEIESWNLYCAIQDRGWPWPVYQEPAVFARAYALIAAEVAAAAKERDSGRK